MTENTNDHALKSGKIIQDTYEIISPIGQGGMGSTFKARHLAMGHLVAVKVIHPALSEDKRALELFKREANLMRELGNSSASDAIVRIETLLTDQSGAYYLIMEYVEGYPLSHYLNKGARLSEDDLNKFAVRLLSALSIIHGRNIVHRDISPDNIMVPNENILEAKILDFGVASNSIGTENSILGDTFAGKIGYASPEQFGLFGGEISSKSDLYSLGLVLLAAAGVKTYSKLPLAEAIEIRKRDADLSGEKLNSDTRIMLEGLLKGDPKHRKAILNGEELTAPEFSANIKYSGGTQIGIGSIFAAATVAAGIIGGALYFGTSKDKAPLPASTVVAQDAVVQPGATAGEESPAVVSPTQDASPKNADAPQKPNGVARKPSSLIIIEAVKERAEEIFKPENPKPPKPAMSPKQAEITPKTPSSDKGAKLEEPEISTPKKAEADPFASIMILVDLGGKANLKQAMKTLMIVEEDVSLSSENRGRAAFMLARMNDPKYYSRKISPLDSPNNEAALHYYRQAVRYGANGLKSEISRLEKSE